MPKEQQTGQFDDLAHFLSGGSKGRGKAGAGATEKPTEGGLADLGDELTEAEASGDTPGEAEALTGDEPSSDTEETTDETPEASHAGEQVAAPAAHGPGFYHWLGGSLLVTGITLGVLPDQSNIVHMLASAGFSANIVAIAGLVLLATAQVLRAMKNAAERADWALSRQLAAAEALRGSVDSIADDEAPRVRSSGTTDNTDVTAALKRLDEKVNNLTRATKMYGKPLMELAGQVTESAEVLNHIRTQTDLIAETIGQGLRKFSDTISERLQKIEQGVAGIDAGAVKQSLDKLESSTQKGFTSLKAEDPAFARVEQKLDATTRALQEALADLKKGDTQRLDATTRALQEAVAELKKGDAAKPDTARLDSAARDIMSKLDAAARDIQRELASVAANVTNVQTTLKTQPKTAPTAAAPAPQPASAPAPAAATSNDAHSGAAQNTAGTHTGSGKNVLGAIAKLKQMKS